MSKVDEARELEEEFANTDDIMQEDEWYLKCHGCGLSLADFSEYYQTEGYCDDCL